MHALLQPVPYRPIHIQIQWKDKAFKTRNTIRKYWAPLLTKSKAWFADARSASSSTALTSALFFAFWSSWIYQTATTSMIYSLCTSVSLCHVRGVNLDYNETNSEEQYIPALKGSASVSWRPVIHFAPPQVCLQLQHSSFSVLQFLPSKHQLKAARKRKGYVKIGTVSWRHLVMHDLAPRMRNCPKLKCIPIHLTIWCSRTNYIPIVANLPKSSLPLQVQDYSIRLILQEKGPMHLYPCELRFL